MRKIYQTLSILVITLLMITGVSVHGATGYTYSHRSEPIYSTVGLEYTQILTFDKLGIPSNLFTKPEDLFIYENTIYIVDSKSNSLFVFDSDFKWKETIDSFEVRFQDFNDEQLGFMNTYDSAKSAKAKIDFVNLRNSGIYTFPLKAFLKFLGFTDLENKIYLADKMNNQIVIVDANDYHVLQVVSTPDDPTFQNKTFKPTKLVTDKKGRIYVISDEVYEGIIEIGPEGKFNRFTGVNYVKLSLWDIFWRTFSTETQLSKSQSILSTTFKSLTIDKRDFIYATSLAMTDNNNVVTDDNAMIKLINPSGIDVLRRNGYNPPKGDVQYIRVGIDLTVRGPSLLTAVAVNDYGVYTVADERHGRLFTYDMEGNLLYISGGSGEQMNAINTPVAIKYKGEKLIVLDQVKKSVIVYEPTDIAEIINRASKYYYEGELELSSKEWEKVVEINSNYEYAYVGIGKNLLDKDLYLEAMENFRIGFDRDYYSKAFKLYRDAKIKQYFPLFMTVVSGLVVLDIGYGIYKRIRYKKDDLETGVGDE